MILTDELALKIKCTDVSPEEYSSIKEQLEAELRKSAECGVPGIGLAAPQIGIPKNMAIVRIASGSAYRLNVDLVNCSILNKYENIIFDGEGCLSFPGRYERTMRWREIHVVDNLVEPFGFIANGLFGVACQHELDHLKGILLPDIALPKFDKKIGPNDPCPCGKINPVTAKTFKYKKCCSSRMA